MPLAKAGDDRLVSLRVVMSLKARILIMQSMQPLLKFFFFTTRCSMHCVNDARLRESDLLETHGMLARRQRVVRVSVLQFCNAADVARVKHGDFSSFLALRDCDVRHLFGVSARCIVHFLSAVQRSRKHAEERNVANVRLKLGLPTRAAAVAAAARRGLL